MQFARLHTLPSNGLSSFNSQSNQIGLNDYKGNRNIICTMMECGRCFSTATRHLTPAAMKWNKNLKGSLWKKEHTKEWKSETRFYLISLYAKIYSGLGEVRGDVVRMPKWLSGRNCQILVSTYQYNGTVKQQQHHMQLSTGTKPISLAPCFRCRKEIWIEKKFPSAGGCTRTQSLGGRMYNKESFMAILILFGTMLEGHYMLS